MKPRTVEDWKIAIDAIEWFQQQLRAKSPDEVRAWIAPPTVEPPQDHASRVEHVSDGAVREIVAAIERMKGCIEPNVTYWLDSAITTLSTLSRQSGRWVPWKPGDALPTDGMYALAVMFPDGWWHRRVAKPASFADWYDIELRYWSIPLQNDPDLPPAYGADQIGGCP